MSVDYKEAIQGMSTQVNQMVEKADYNVVPALEEIGKAIRDQVVLNAKDSEKEFYYYKGNKVPNTHISQDVIFKVKNSRKNKLTGNRSKYVSVSGGKKTWSKWHLANDGHVAQNGTYVPGSNFADKAAIMAEPTVDMIIDELIGGIVNG